MEINNYIVIGGSSGIGLSLVDILTEEGNQVYHFARNAGDWKNKDRVIHQPFDVTSGELPDTEIMESINGFVYCPGTISLKSFQQFTDNDFREEFEINVVGAIRMIRHFFKLLIKGKPSSIVLFSTVAVKQGMAFHTSVSTVKGALEGLMHSMAAEFAPNIRVNIVAPSLTHTRLAERILNSDERREASNKRHPLGRIGNPLDIANMTAFLLSEKSDWITGQVLAVDGGLSTIRK